MIELQPELNVSKKTITFISGQKTYYKYDDNYYYERFHYKK